MANTIRLRRGLEADRTTITPAEGEMIYTTDTNSLYIGDGSTAGGVKFDFNLDDIDVDTITANQLDINGTVTAYGLTVGTSSAIKAITVDDTFPFFCYRSDLTANTSGYAFNITSAGDLTLKPRNDDGSAVSSGFMSLAHNGDISFYEATGTTPKFFWDASAERLGIGTDSPSAVLEVNTPSPVIRSTHSFSGDYLQLFHNGSGAYIDFSADDLIIRGASSAERMRIDSSGKVGIGKTSAGESQASGHGFFFAPGSAGFFSHVQTVNTGNYMSYYNRIGTSSGGFATFRVNDSTVGSITSNGSTTAYNTSSDYRLKEDVQPMSGSIDRVKALNPVNFAWKVDGTRVDGFLAHEAQEVVPEAVTGTKDAMRTEEYEVTPAVEATYDDEGNELTAAVEAVMGTREVIDPQAIDQSKLVPLLTAALQEAVAKIESLETRIAALESN